LHTRTHTCAHTHRTKHTHTYVHTHTHIYTHSLSAFLTPHIHPHTVSLLHQNPKKVLRLSHTHAHTRTQTRARAHTHILSLSLSLTHTHTHTNTCKQTHTRANRQTVHTPTHSLISSRVCSAKDIHVEMQPDSARDASGAATERGPTYAWDPIFSESDALLRQVRAGNRLLQSKHER